MRGLPEIVSFQAGKASHSWAVPALTMPPVAAIRWVWRQWTMVRAYRATRACCSVRENNDLRDFDTTLLIFVIENVRDVV